MIYQIHEKYSKLFVVSPQQIQNYLNEIKSNHPHITLDQYDLYLQPIISQKCYHNITNITQFNQIIQNNIDKATQNNDFEYMQYITQKFHLNPNKKQKIKISLKQSSPTQNISHSPLINPKYSINSQIFDQIGFNSINRFENFASAMKNIHKYIYKYQLQDRHNKNIINPNLLLSTHLSPLNNNDCHYTYCNLHKYVQNIIIKSS